MLPNTKLPSLMICLQCNLTILTSLGLNRTLSSRSEQTFNRAWELVSEFKTNTVTENDWLIYAAAPVK